MLRKCGPQEWIHRESQNVMEMNFKFLSKNEPSTYATQLANNMHLYAEPHYISVIPVVICVTYDFSLVFTFIGWPQNI
jgi:secreted Zn-dependent insulinase-like peptidase